MSLTKFIVACCLILNLSQAATTIPVSDEETFFTVKQESPTILEGTIQSGNIVVQPMEVDEGYFVRIFIPGFHTSSEIGNPELPQLHKLIEIPQNAIPRIEVLFEEVEYYIEENNFFDIKTKIKMGRIDPDTKKGFVWIKKSKLIHLANIENCQKSIK